MQVKQMPRYLLMIILILSQAATSVAPVWAQESTPGNPWANVFDENGNLLPSVVDMGEVELNPPPDWWPSNGVTDALGFYPTYHQYVTAAGDVVIVPSASTLFLMALNAGESGLTEAYGAVGNGAGTAVLASALLLRILDGTVSGQNILNRIGEYGYVDPGQFVDALISGEEDFWSLAFMGDAFNLLYELLRGSVEDQMFATTFLLYVQGTCASAPTGCPADLCLIVPTACADPTGDPGSSPTPPTCPGATVTIGAPVIQIYPVAPPSPLVVGQDPEKRGADVQLAVTIPPAIHEYYIPIPVWEELEECQVPDGGYTGTLNCKTDSSLPAYNGYWERSLQLVRFECEHHVDVYPEPATSVSATATLTEASRAWIVHDLGAYYYGAEVYQGSYNLIPGLKPANTGCSGDGTCFANALVPKIQFHDPGQYALNVRVQTAGTPVSTGRLLTGSGALSVSMISVRLIEPAGQ